MRSARLPAESGQITGLRASTAILSFTPVNWRYVDRIERLALDGGVRARVTLMAHSVSAHAPRQSNKLLVIVIIKTDFLSDPQNIV